MAYNGVLATTTAGQSIGTSFASVNFEAENHDTDAFHSTVSNTSRLTVPAALGGYYDIYAQITFPTQSADTNYLSIQLLKNGATVLAISEVQGNTAAKRTVGIGLTVSLAVGDYVEVQAKQETAGNLINTAGYNFFGMHKVLA